MDNTPTPLRRATSTFVFDVRSTFLPRTVPRCERSQHQSTHFFVRQVDGCTHPALLTKVIIHQSLSCPTPSRPSPTHAIPPLTRKYPQMRRIRPDKYRIQRQTTRHPCGKPIRRQRTEPRRSRSFISSFQFSIFTRLRSDNRRKK